MLAKKLVGRNAATLKYDILSALAVLALSEDKNKQRLVLRIIALITARYNWQFNELSMGQKEIARLWSVNERTVKREMAKFRTIGWITVKRPGARGRVALYEIELKQILLDTQKSWPAIGPDFIDRMQVDIPTPQPSNIVPFQNSANPEPTFGDDLHGRVLSHLQQRDPELYTAWFRHLNPAERLGHLVVLTAPSRFMADYIATHLAARILSSYSRFDPSVREIKILAQG